MSSGVRRLLAVLAVVVGLVLLGLPAAASTAVTAGSSATGTTDLSSTGAPPPALPSAADDNGTLSPMTSGGDQGADEAALSAASAQAESSGAPVTVAALTTETSQTTADPDGELTTYTNALPVRVKQQGAWTPVSASLQKAADGMLAPVAVPGDSVEFSEGGTGTLAEIDADGTSLSLSWPGTVPAPAISGSSATYAGILPGVNLVLTATSAQAGGFSSVIEVLTAAAASDPQLAQLALAVKAKGVTLRQAAGGGLTASGTHTAGFYSAGTPLMWDSSSVPSSASAATQSAAAAAAQSVGASLAPPGLAGARSTYTGPSRGARLATVGTSVTAGGTKLGLEPDSKLLASPSTSYPVFIDPSFTWSISDGGVQAYDEVQSACPTASHYDTTDSAYWSLGVGYDGFGDCNGANGYAYSYYQMAVPSYVWGGYIDSAYLNVNEAYTASCSASADVTASETDPVNSGTDWNNKPASVSDVATVDVPPGPADSCNSTYDESSGDWKQVGFNVLSLIDKGAADDWKNTTIRLWENGDSNDVDWKRFGKNAQLQVTFDQTPNTPSGLQISTNGSGTDCTDSPYPWVGNLSSGGTKMSAVLSDKDGDELEGIFQYKTVAATNWTQLNSSSTAITSGTQASATIPASFTNALAAGTQVEWKVEADNGAPDDADSAWSPHCYFYADPTDPPAPAVTAGFTGTPAAGTDVSFTLTSNDTPSDPATKLVWGLDDVPSSASPPTAQVLTLASGKTAATLTVRIPSPGPHVLYAYAEDAAGNDSTWAGTTFSAGADASVTYSSFAQALAAGQPYDNTMISSSASSSGTADADGAGNSFQASALEAAGWQPGGKVTAYGATFTLPSFGAGSPDNLLAANQTIDLPAGSQGTSLVFLATATNALAAQPDASNLPQTADTTSPAIAAGTAVAGQECDTYESGLSGTSCTVPAGTITYATSSGASAEPYDLTVPDWITGPAGPAAIEFPDRATGTGSLADAPKIYAFSVPLNPGAAVSSVTLPDIGSTLTAAGSISDSRDTFPNLHIIGLAVANTTTATPGSSTTLASGQTWTGAWASPTEGTYAPKTGTSFSNQTFRITMRASVGGSAVRLRLSDDLGWLAGTSGKDLDIGAVTVAEQGSGASVTGTPVAATFGGSGSVVVPEGGDVYTDPIALTVTPGETLSVSVDLTNSLSYLVEHTMCDDCLEYISAAGSGNQTTNTTGAPFSGTGTVSGEFSNILTGLDVQTAGIPTVVVLGDGMVDALGSNGKVSPTGLRIGDDLAAELQQQAGTGSEPAFGVVGESIESNELLTDADVGSTGLGGPSTLSRLAPDVLAEPNAGTVIVDEGLQDLMQAGDSSTIAGTLMADGYTELVAQLSAWGLNSVLGTLTPCSGYTGSGSSPEDACTTGAAPTVDANRTNVNINYLMAQYGNEAPVCLLGPCQLAVDFDGAVTNGASPEALQTADDSGSHVNLTNPGYTAVTGTIPTTILTAASPPGY